MPERRIADGPDEVHMSQLAKLTMRDLALIWVYGYLSRSVAVREFAQIVGFGRQTHRDEKAAGYCI